MPSRRSQGMLGLIRSHKEWAGQLSREVIMRIDPAVETVARLRMNGTTARAEKSLGMPALMVFPGKEESGGGVLLHLHGGAYVSGGMLQCRALISPICAAAKTPALTFCYRLAPRFPYPAQLEDALRAYRFLREKGFSARQIALVGESAGGNLALALTLKLRALGEELPAGLALLSPWVDLEQKGESYQTLRDKDATLNAEELMESAIQFAGGRERLGETEISPVHADFSGFPPTLIHCGTQEILLSDAERLDGAMLRDGVRVRLVRWAGMCHVFQAFGFEESKAANQQIGAFLRQCLDEAGAES